LCEAVGDLSQQVVIRLLEPTDHASSLIFTRHRFEQTPLPRLRPQTLWMLHAPLVISE
jgi:hypothetical protein